jgi:hypothetical protein
VLLLSAIATMVTCKFNGEAQYGSRQRAPQRTNQRALLQGYPSGVTLATSVEDAQSHARLEGSQVRTTVAFADVLHSRLAKIGVSGTHYLAPRPLNADVKSLRFKLPLKYFLDLPDKIKPA